MNINTKRPGSAHFKYIKPKDETKARLNVELQFNFLSFADIFFSRKTLLSFGFLFSTTLHSSVSLFKCCKNAESAVMWSAIIIEKTTRFSKNETKLNFLHLKRFCDDSNSKNWRGHWIVAQLVERLLPTLKYLPFKSSHRQSSFTLNCLKNCAGRTLKRKKRPRMAN